MPSPPVSVRTARHRCAPGPRRSYLCTKVGTLLRTENAVRTETSPDFSYLPDDAVVVMVVMGATCKSFFQLALSWTSVESWIPGARTVPEISVSLAAMRKNPFTKNSVVYWQLLRMRVSLAHYS